MEADTIVFDSTDARPLPKWLTDQRDGLHAWQPPKTEMQEDHSLGISLITTVAFILLTIIILTFFFNRKNKKRKLS